MPGHSIYYIPPRLVGSIANWSGKDSPDGRSWLLDNAQSLGFDTVWFSPFFETTHLRAATGDGNPSENCLYAIRGHGVFDPEFSATKMTGTRDDYSSIDLAAIDKLDREHLDHFTAQATKQGVKVVPMADLVFNHVAADHPAVTQERKDINAILSALPKDQQLRLIKKTMKDHDDVEKENIIGIAYTDASGANKEYLFKFAYNDKLEVLDWQGKPNLETAQINYASPAARDFFVSGADGQDGYWKQVINWYMDRGMQDFRCDVAYRVPPDWWEELITHAATRNPNVFMMAETLGGSDMAMRHMAHIKVQDANGKERPGFDLGMISNYWWNFTDGWLPDQELPRLKKMAKYGGAASPDNHDTPETLAGKFQKAFKNKDKHDQIVADICMRNFTVSSLIGNSVFMQMGYELCKETQNGVFKGQGSPEEWKDLVKARPAGHVLNISERVKAVNALKKSLCVENCYVDIMEHREMQDGKLIKLACDYVDADTGDKIAEAVMVINKKPEDGPVDVTDSGLLGLENNDKLKRMDAKGENRPVVRDVLIYHTPLEDIVPSKLKPVPRAIKKMFSKAP
ncbi:MAG: hypothetical protein ACAH83_04195 [Alphaproteobacteria bacterium]